jgi:hypothetical protein
MVACFEINDGIELLASNFTPYKDNNGHRVYLRNLLTNKKLGVNLDCKLERARLNNYLLYTFVPGCALAFRRSLLEFVDRVWYPEWAHDAVLSTVAKLRGTYFF